jgi:hypothetical protein
MPLPYGQAGIASSGSFSFERLWAKAWHIRNEGMKE